MWRDRAQGLGIGSRAFHQSFDVADQRTTKSKPQSLLRRAAMTVRERLYHCLDVTILDNHHAELSR